MLPKARERIEHTPSTHPIQRIRWWYGFLLLVVGILILRTFYIQVIRHDHYQQAATQSQFKEYEIPASRGTISAYSGDHIVPVVLNETLYTLYADPTHVKDPAAAAGEIQHVIGGSVSKYEDLLKTPNTRYVILAKKLSKDVKESLESLDLLGVGLREYEYRTYPNGKLASQLLGIVTDNGNGTYGVEEYLDSLLKGTPGQLRAITDARGVPLASNNDNVLVKPQAGENAVLTIDVALQEQAETILKEITESTKSLSSSVVVLDADSGAVKAMANYPTYDPSKYWEVEDSNVFNNASVSQPLEIGSIMKSLTAAAALDQGVVTTDSSYYDPASYEIDGATVKNVEEDGGPGVKTVKDILKLSLNTGATWLLMQMGGGEINQQARETWHSYMVDHYQLGKLTGIEQGYEVPGVIPDPNEGYGLNIKYANTAFGQGMTATPLQMAAAFAAVINGGTYYKPYLVDRLVSDGNQENVTQKKVVRDDVISEPVSSTMREYLEYTLRQNAHVYGGLNLPYDSYEIGGKTGTAQISNPEGGYYEDRYNGTYLGFVGGKNHRYVVAVRVSQPSNIVGYAGAKAAAPVFVRLADALINSYDVIPVR